MQHAPCPGHLQIERQALLEAMRPVFAEPQKFAVEGPRLGFIETAQDRNRSRQLHKYLSLNKCKALYFSFVQLSSRAATGKAARALFSPVPGCEQMLFSPLEVNLATPGKSLCPIGLAPQCTRKSPHGQTSLPP